MGVVRLSYDDFSILTVDEYKAVVEAHSAQREAEYRNDWERVRTLAAITIQPHVKKGVTARKLISFPWDNERPGTKKAPKLTAEQQRERARKLVEKLEKL